MSCALALSKKVPKNVKTTRNPCFIQGNSAFHLVVVQWCNILSHGCAKGNLDREPHSSLSAAKWCMKPISLTSCV